MYGPLAGHKIIAHLLIKRGQQQTTWECGEGLISIVYAQRMCAARRLFPERHFSSVVRRFTLVTRAFVMERRLLDSYLRFDRLSSM